MKPQWIVKKNEHHYIIEANSRQEAEAYCADNGLTLVDFYDVSILF